MKQITMTKRPVGLVRDGKLIDLAKLNFPAKNITKVTASFVLTNFVDFHCNKMTQTTVLRNENILS